MTDQTPALVQSLNPGELIDLYELDMSPIGFNTTLYFTPSSQSGKNISFGNQIYVSAAVQVTGFQKNSDGSAVQPVMMIPNVDKGGTALLATYGGLVGCRVTKRMTFKAFLDFLDDGVTPNPNADSGTQFMPEIWYIEQKTDHTRQFIKFNLKALTELNGKMLPNRRIWKDTCERTYRVWDANANAFNYTNITCPYTDAAMYDEFGNVTTDPTKDKCGMDYKNCVLRFKDATLPGWFFPGVQKVTS